MPPATRPASRADAYEEMARRLVEHGICSPSILGHSARPHQTTAGTAPRAHPFSVPAADLAAAPAVHSPQSATRNTHTNEETPR